MRYLSTFVSLLTIAFMGAQKCEAAPLLDGAARNYTLVFAEDGELSKRDVHEDPAATIVGKGETIVSTGQNGVQILQGTAVIESEKTPIKLSFGNGVEGALAEHSKLAVSRRGEQFDLLSLAGEMRVLMPNQERIVDANGPMTLCVAEPLTLAPSTSRIDFEFAEHPSKEEPIRLLASSGTKFSVKGHSFSLTSGTAFVQLPARVELRTPGGVAHSTKPYMVSFRMVEDVLCVENCTPCDHITFDIRGEDVKLEPFSGCMLKHCEGSTAAVPDDGILRRNLRVKSDGVFTAMIAEYDPLTLLESHQELRRTVKNPVTAHDRFISESVFKGIAVWQELCGGVDSFGSDLKVKNVEMLGYFKNPLKFAAKYEVLK